MADNFSRQYSQLCPDRVPLFLHPLNECNVPVRPGRGGQGRGLDGRGWREGSPSTALSWARAYSPGAAPTPVPAGSGRLWVNYPYGGPETPCPPEEQLGAQGRPCSGKGGEIVKVIRMGPRT